MHNAPLLKRSIVRLLVIGAAVLVTPLVNAQSTRETGSLRGKVVDKRGQPLPGAVVRAAGPQGSKGAETDINGNYLLPFLAPGTYEVTVTMDGFNTQVLRDVQVAAAQAISLPVRMDDGSEIVIVKGAALIDTTSSTSVTKINLQDVINNYAVSRDFTSAFDFAPGVNPNSGVEGGNPSVAGATGLENQYIIGGVNVTSSGFGSLGAYSNSYGAATTTGMSSEFFSDLDVIEGGYDAQYGGALGGVFNATLQSGGNDWHGGVALFSTPKSLEGSPGANHHLVGGGLHTTGVDEHSVALHIRGPIIRDKLFFFVGINPVWNRTTRNFRIEQEQIDMNGIPLPNANKDYSMGYLRTDNYVMTLDWQLNQNHRLRFQTFGYPQDRKGIIRDFDYARRVNASQTYGVPVQPTPMGVPDSMAADGSNGSYSIKDNSYAIHYTGSITPHFSVEASVSFHRSTVSESPDGALDQPKGSNSVLYLDSRYGQVYNEFKRNEQFPGVGAPITAPITYLFGGIGDYLAKHNDENLTYYLKFIHNFNFLGSHELKYGAEIATLKYFEDIRYSGSGPLVNLNMDANGDNVYDDPDPASQTRVRSGVVARITCYGASIYAPSGMIATNFAEACPTMPYGPFAGTGFRYRIAGGVISPAQGNTVNKETNFFIQDNWTIKNVTLNLGMRYTRSKIYNPDRYTLLNTSGTPLENKYGWEVGSMIDDPGCFPFGQMPDSCYIEGKGKFVGNSYTFKGEFSPRIGLSWDVLGNGKSKIYAKVARLYERIPNNLLQRSFGNQFYSGDIRYTSPDLSTQDTVDTFGNAASTPTRVGAGTRLPYKDDFSVGYQFELAPRFSVDIRANYRTQGRILEDTQTAPVEALNNYYYKNYLNGPGGFCLNCDPGQTELFPGAGQAIFGNYILANMNENTPNTAYICDDFANSLNCRYEPISFGKVVNKYKAFSVTLKKDPGEGEHLGLHATYRLSRVTGNYEGLFRSDNEQHDPNITSLFDFPLTRLTESQYTLGRLNNDSPHNLKVFVSYRDLGIKNLRAGFAFKWYSGSLKTPILAHPFYGNGGELPGTNPAYFEIDLDGDSSSDFSLLRDYQPVVRGAYGRNPDIASWDFNMGYKWVLGKSSVDFSLLIQNVFNEVGALSQEMNIEDSTGLLNPNYLQASSFQRQRTIQLGVKWSF